MSKFVQKTAKNFEIIQKTTNAWEQKRVGDIFEITRGEVISTTKLSPIKSSKYIYPVYSSKTVNNGLLGYHTEYLFDTAITWTTDGAGAGKVVFRPGKFYSTNVSGVLLGKINYTNNAVAHALNNVAYKHVASAGIPKLMNNVMAEIKICIPSLSEESNKISILINSLNMVVSLLQCKPKTC
ncbi:restriction endonuclease subunit S [Mycoplasma sp. HS2188]|uniref:restriction endonuclease subunit S n=1 Tax=Mycoplasma sp. HS2188 TaxID=2976765 RepID=UPI0021A99780|nr:restriction endonuclease subunit S [Mycoplasma sp. HS2188]MCT4469941.1 restriction endonuclease subunit S [Mycoplasma sp. HS2188]